MSLKKFLPRFEDRGPFTLNGFGTAWYGKRDFRADYSYITTEWVVLAYIPMIPIRSLRVRYRGAGEYRWYLGFGSSENYSVCEKRFPPNGKQVLYTYSYLALLTCWIYFASTSGGTMIFVSFILLGPTPWVLQHLAEKRYRSDVTPKDE
jgi:hypothetical protein